MFIAASFTIAKPWKRRKCPPTDEWVKKTCCIMEYYSAIKRMKFCHLQKHGSREYNAKQNKPVRERQIPYDFTYMWNLRNKTNDHRGTKREANQETDS